MSTSILALSANAAILVLALDQWLQRRRLNRVEPRVMMLWEVWEGIIKAEAGRRERARVLNSVKEN